MKVNWKEISTFTKNTCIWYRRKGNTNHFCVYNDVKTCLKQNAAIILLLLLYISTLNSRELSSTKVYGLRLFRFNFNYNLLSYKSFFNKQKFCLFLDIWIKNIAAWNNHPKIKWNKPSKLAQRATTAHIKINLVP